METETEIKTVSRLDRIKQAICVVDVGIVQKAVKKFLSDVRVAVEGVDEDPAIKTGNLTAKLVDYARASTTYTIKYAIVAQAVQRSYVLTDAEMRDLKNWLIEQEYFQAWNLFIASYAADNVNELIY